MPGAKVPDACRGRLDGLPSAAIRAGVLAFGGGHADRPCPFGTTEARLPTATCGHPCRRGSSWPPRPRHHATTAIQTGSTAEHATTPEHPCPGVVARTGPQAVNPSPVSGESMASGGYACGRASHHQPHRGTPPTLPALQPKVATDPRWASLQQAAPGRLLPRGRTRTGLEAETTTRSMGPMANKEVRG